MRNLSLLDVILDLFDGAAGGGDGAGGDGAATAGGDAGTQGETQASPVPTRPGKKAGEFDNVIFGKQQDDTAQSADAGQTQPQEEGPIKATSDTLEEKRKSFRDLVEGEYKDIYTEETQKIINRRFKETSTLREQLAQNQPVIDMLMQRYNVKDGDISKLTAAIENDDAYWSEAADEAGMTVDQYKQMQKLERENAELLRARRQQESRQQADAQLAKWYQESEVAKQTYPNFDLNVEVKNPDFMSLLRANIPVQKAYEVVHMDDIKNGVAQTVAKQTEKKVVDGIRAKGTRPTENGTVSQSAFTVRDDPSKWSKKDRSEVVRRVMSGEKIVL